MPEKKENNKYYNNYEKGLYQGGMKAENLAYAIGGAANNTYRVTREIESLVNELIKINAVLQDL